MSILGAIFTFVAVSFIAGMLKEIFNVKPPSLNDELSENDKPNGQIRSPMDVFYPFIDLYSFYALEGQKNWTPEKVQLIKSRLNGIPEVDQNQILLRERLKKDVTLPITRLIYEFKVSEIGADLELCEMSVAIIADLLLLDDITENRFKATISHLLRSLDLSDRLLLSYLSEVFGSESSEKERAKPFTKDHASVEWACSVLGLSPDDITPEKVQKAYRAKIKEYHPDKHQNLPESIQQLLHEKTQEVNEARDMLIT